MNRLQKQLIIRTPEGIAFPLIIGNPMARFIALIIDIGIKTVLYSALMLILNGLQILSADLAGAVYAIGYFLISLGYPIALEWFWRGRTVGKRLMRLQVMDAHGLRLQFSQVLIRNLVRVIDSLPLFYLAGAVCAFLSPRGQRLGDIAANTIVVYHPKITEPDLSQIEPEKHNSFRDYPHLAARLRLNVSAAETAIALSAILRRDTFDTEARPRVFNAIRARLEAAGPFPPEVTDGLSDEHYVRNALEILLRSATGIGNPSRKTQA